VCSYIRRREHERASHHSTGVISGLATGVRQLSTSVVGAATGMVSAPLRSTSVHGWGVGTLLKGMGKGVLGALAKPMSGAVDLVTHTSQGILRSTGLHHNLPQLRGPAVLQTERRDALRVRYKLERLVHAARSDVERARGWLRPAARGACYMLFHAPVTLVHPASADELPGPTEDGLLVVCWECVIVFGHRDRVVVCLPTHDAVACASLAAASTRGCLTFTQHEHGSTPGPSTPLSGPVAGEGSRVQQHHLMLSPQHRAQLEKWLQLLERARTVGCC